MVSRRSKLGKGVRHCPPASQSPSTLQVRLTSYGPDPSPWPRRLLLLGLSVVLVGIAAWWFLAGLSTTVETASFSEARTGSASAPSVTRRVGLRRGAPAGNRHVQGDR